jgi:RNA polymerase sigma-32 factor
VNKCEEMTVEQPNKSQKAFLSKAMKAPYLEPHEEYALAVNWKDHQDQQALHKLTQAHMRLVISIASKFRHYGLAMNDLIQEGHIGLLEAASRFDPEREVRFATYATWWIKASIQDYVLRNWSIVRGGTSSAQKSLFFNLRRLRAKLSYGQEPLNTATLHQTIADAIGVSARDVATMDARLSGADTSLDAPLRESEDEGGASERMDFLVSDDPLPDELTEQSIDGERQLDNLAEALECLNPRERAIIEQRHLSENKVTLESLGESFGVSKERIRQIESKALSRLKEALSRKPALIEHRFQA